MNEVSSNNINTLKIDDSSLRAETSQNSVISQITIISKNVLNTLASILITSYLASSSFCILREDVSRSNLISASLMGIAACSLILTLFSARFTVVNSNRMGYLVCLLMMFSTKPCQGSGDIYAMGPELRTAEWRNRLNELQGAVVVVGLIQLLVGFADMKMLIRLIRPVSIAPTMILIGLFVIKTAAIRMASTSWILFMVTSIVMLMFYFIANSFTSTHAKEKYEYTRIRSKLYLGVICVAIMWSLCALLSMFELIYPRNAARTDVYTGIYDYVSTVIFSFPYQWSVPVWKSQSVLLVLPAAFISVFEIIADFYIHQKGNAAKILIEKSNLTTIIKLEAILCLAMNTMGVVIGLNVNVKKDGRKMQDICSAVILIAMALFGPLCAFFTTVPEPIMAALIILVFFSATLEGFELLKFVDIKSTREVYIMSISFFVAVIIPTFIKEDLTMTNITVIDEALKCLLYTEFMIAGFTAIILDNFFNVFAEEPLVLESQDRRKYHERNEEENNAGHNTEVCDCCFPFFV